MIVSFVNMVFIENTLHRLHSLVFPVKLNCLCMTGNLTTVLQAHLGGSGLAVSEQDQKSESIVH